MTKQLITLLDPESAKAIQEAAKLGSSMTDLAKEGGSWLSGVLGDLPRDIVGLFGDWVQFKRAERWIDYNTHVAALLKARGVQPPYADVSPSLAVPLITAALDDSRDELKTLWARLLANALDPARKDYVRNSFIDIIKRLEPLDALILQAVATLSGEVLPNVYYAVAMRFSRGEDEVRVSLENLTELRLVGSPQAVMQTHIYLTPKGKMLLRAVSE